MKMIYMFYLSSLKGDVILKIGLGLNWS